MGTSLQHRKKKYRVLVYLLLFSCTISAQSIMETLEDTRWEGTGTLMNSPATYKMHWERTLDNSFIKLQFENKRVDKDGKEINFKSHAYYKVGEASKVTGTWFDSRGISFPLKGSVSKKELIIFWGSPETEEGKTRYTLQSDTEIHVMDYILRNGTYLPFGKAQYTLIP